MQTPATYVRVLAECVLNDPDHRSLGLLKPGDECIIAGGWYANECITSGLVERLRDDGEAFELRQEIEAEIQPEVFIDENVDLSAAQPIPVAASDLPEFRVPAAAGKSGGDIPGRISDLGTKPRTPGRPGGKTTKLP